MELNSQTNSCRLCFSTKYEYINISENSASGLNVAQAIDKYVQVEVVDEDLLPKIVCVSCWNIIESFHCFHEMVIAAQTGFLTKVVKRERKEDDEGNEHFEEFFVENVYIDSLMEFDENATIEENFCQSNQTEQNSIANTTLIDTFICDVCEMTFDTKTLIERHIIEAHVKSIRNKIDSGGFRGRTHPNNSINFLDSESDSNNSIFDRVGKDGSLPRNTDSNSLPDYFDTTCDMCPTTFNSLNQARDHYIKEHKIAKGYVKCCGAKFKERCHIKDHISLHLNPNIFRCDDCGISLNTKANLKRHIQRNHENEEEIYSCDLCVAKYKNKETLKQHRSDVHDIVDKRIRYPYEQITIPDYFDMSCDECPTIMKSFKHAISHYLEEHQIVKGYVKCCGKKLKAPSIVRDHIEFHQNLNIFRCEICEKSFPSKIILGKHNVRHKKIDELGCNICGKTFTNLHSSKRHRQTHDPKDEKYKCHTCNKIFSAQFQLDAHLKDSHTEKKGSTEICEYCAERFTHKYVLRYHIKRIHSGEPTKPKEKVQCTVCNQWFTTKSSLITHMLTHDTGPVKCEKCYKIFANQVSLYAHDRRFHKNGGLMFKCHLCPKIFRIKKDLEDHIGVHTNEKKHKCSYCDAAFIWRTEMYKHQKKKHFEQWSLDKEKKQAARGICP